MKIATDAQEGFVAVSADGLFYWPPRSMGEALQTIAKRSLYEGEPGWEMITTSVALDLMGYERVTH